MRSGRVVITSLFLDCATRMEDRWECMFVEEFVAEPTVEALDTAVLRRFSRIDKVLRDSSQSRPFEHLVASKTRDLDGIINAITHATSVRYQRRTHGRKPLINDGSGSRAESAKAHLRELRFLTGVGPDHLMRAPRGPAGDGLRRVYRPYERVRA